MAHVETQLRLHKGLEYRRDDQGVQLLSVVTGKRSLLRGDPALLMPVFMSLREGIPTRDVKGKLSQCTPPGRHPDRATAQQTASAGRCPRGS